MSRDREERLPDWGPPENPPTRPEPDQSAYSDAYYRSAPEEGRTTYGYNPAHYYAGEDGETAAHRGQIGLKAILALSIICVLVASMLAIGGMYLLFRSRTAAPEHAIDAELYSRARLALDEEEDMPLLAEPLAPGTAPMAGEDIYAAACGQVVGVTTAMGPISRSGSGVIVSADGYIITNYHVIETAVGTGRLISVIMFDGSAHNAQIVGTERDSDLAVLKIDAEGLSVAPLGDSDQLSVGGSIYAVGNPMGDLPYTMTTGVVSAMDRRITTEENVTVNMFQFDAAVNSGNSGGPVYNAYGQVVGIVTAKSRAAGVEGLGFAIPISDAVHIANELITKGYVSGKAYLGLRLGDLSPSAARYYRMVPGAYIYSVAAQSAAEAAGLLAGDIITAVDDTPIVTADELVSTIRSYKAGDTAELTVYREADYIKVPVTFGEALPAATPEPEV